jgi:hypothetical protein
MYALQTMHTRAQSRTPSSATRVQTVQMVQVQCSVYGLLLCVVMKVTVGRLASVLCVSVSLSLSLSLSLWGEEWSMSLYIAWALTPHAQETLPCSVQTGSQPN